MKIVIPLSYKEEKNILVRSLGLWSAFDSYVQFYRNITGWNTGEVNARNRIHHRDDRRNSFRKRSFHPDIASVTQSRT